MKKLELNLDALEEEEFSTTVDGTEDRGTVRGHSHPDFSCPVTCDSICPSISGPAVCDCQPCTADAVSCP